MHFLGTGNGIARQGEGTFLKLNDGKIMFAYTYFWGEHWADHCTADIAAIYSSDEGESWSEPEIIVKHDERALNIMCPSLFRMADGNIGLTFCRKEGPYCMPCFCYSSDEGKSFSEYKKCIEEDAYRVIENSHTIVLKSGRILIPVNNHEGPESPIHFYGKMQTLASDDCGKSWAFISDPVASPFGPDCTKTGLQETCFFQRKDGRIRAMSRTDIGCQLECYSSDEGETWTAPNMNKFFTSPEAPLMMKNVGKYTLAVFNPVPRFNTRNECKRTWGRTPLVCAVSGNDGESFDRIYYLETDPENAYCYPAIYDGGNYLLISYYHSNNLDVPLRATRIIKIDYSEISE